MGRFIIWSKSAFEKLDDIFGEQYPVLALPRFCVSNALLLPYMAFPFGLFFGEQSVLCRFFWASKVLV